MQHINKQVVDHSVQPDGEDRWEGSTGSGGGEFTIEVIS